MNNWRAFGYIFFGCGSVLFIFALGTFFSKIAVISQTPYISQEVISTSLIAIAPYLFLGTLWHVIGGLGYYAGREKIETVVSLNKPDETI
ncbi:hypothetical protein MUO66_00150 [Candidatus Bathyarchaeota archaeon]|nr:hypothetical protein [Candidatus Bathyarchaeota archaeon]